MNRTHKKSIVTHCFCKIYLTKFTTHKNFLTYGIHIVLLIGHGLKLQHFRMNPECGVLEELPPIDVNLQYDFDYQQTVHLPAERLVLPVRYQPRFQAFNTCVMYYDIVVSVLLMQGDVLKLDCMYDTATSRRTGVTIVSYMPITYIFIMTKL